MLLLVLIPQHYFLSQSDGYALTYGQFGLFTGWVVPVPFLTASMEDRSFLLGWIDDMISQGFVLLDTAEENCSSLAFQLTQQLSFF